MKKIFISLFIALAAFIPLYAQSNEFEQLSFKELVEKQKLLNQALVQKKEMKKVKIIPGIYKIGTDIPAGKYVVNSLKSDDDDTHYLFLYKSYVEGVLKDSLGWNILKPEQPIVIDLIDGTYMQNKVNLYMQRFVSAFEAEE